MMLKKLAMITFLFVISASALTQNCYVSIPTVSVGQRGTGYTTNNLYICQQGNSDCYDLGYFDDSKAKLVYITALSANETGSQLKLVYDVPDTTWTCTYITGVNRNAALAYLRVVLLDP